MVTCQQEAYVHHSQRLGVGGGVGEGASQSLAGESQRLVGESQRLVGESQRLVVKFPVSGG